MFTVLNLDQSSVATALERQKAELLILQLTERESFAELFNKLDDKSEKRVKHDSAKLSLFVGSDSTMCLMGQLSKLTVSDDLKYPILVSAEHLAVVQMLREVHEDNHHEGAECVRSLVQQKFRVIGLQNAMRSIKSKCVKCKKLLVQPILAHMVDLLKERVECNVDPFKNNRADSFGPFEVTVLCRPVKH